MNHVCSILFIVLLAALPGCGFLRVSDNPVGSLQVTSLGGDAVAVEGDYSTALYSDQLTTDASFYISDVSVDQLISGDFQTGQVVHVEKLWQPKAGKTPLDSSATNVSIRYVVFAHGEVGIYRGGGFATFQRHAGSTRVTVSMLDSSLRLSESTAGFRDLLGPTQMIGKVTAKLDRANTRKLHYLLSQRVTDMLGESTLVFSGDPSAAPAN